LFSERYRKFFFWHCEYIQNDPNPFIGWQCFKLSITPNPLGHRRLSGFTAQVKFHVKNLMSTCLPWAGRTTCLPHQAARQAATMYSFFGTCKRCFRFLAVGGAARHALRYR
jgi:hypothetical protein